MLMKDLFYVVLGHWWIWYHTELLCFPLAKEGNVSFRSHASILAAWLQIEFKMLVSNGKTVIWCLFCVSKYS